MPKQDEKARRKQLLNAMREQQRQSARESLPASISALKGLFDFLDRRLSESDCDDTLRIAREFIRVNGLNEANVIGWLEANGGHCDCEALNNVEDVLAEAVPGYEQIRGDNHTVH